MTDKEASPDQTKPATATSGSTKMSPSPQAPQPLAGGATTTTTTAHPHPHCTTALPMASPSLNPDLISVTIAPFTGGPFTLSVSKRDSIEDLKKTVAKKLKVLKDRICLLYRERQLFDGTLEGNSLVEGSRITLLPRAETGLLAQKPEQSVMQALESLNDSQVRSHSCIIQLLLSNKPVVPCLCLDELV
eukprot:maker-scaffold257_size234952-snap-gene-1.21 protein:Tk12564 transcript:maker-scaffold257_size234952-snap-gene-1.21-mRNA-1 annotation:"PREDICTED: hypothetical protein LOC100742717"